ncbi:MAG: T9SS type A sorting domain-containing protein, partial [Bacteroidia bacterium]
GTWTCTVTDGNGCVATRTFNITQPPVLTAAPVSQTNISCFGGSNGAASILVTGGTPGYNYNWTPGNPTGDGTPSVSGLIAGTWTCTITDANSCVTAITFTISQPNLLVLSGSATPSTICAGNSTSASVSNTGGTGTVNYVWMPGNLIGANQTLTPATTTTYTITGTDANGCIATQTLAVTVNTLPIVTLSGNTSFCAGGNTLLTGSSGGTSQWYRNGVVIVGANTNTYTATTAGVYNMIKANLNGCFDSAAVGITVVVNALPVVTNTSAVAPLCFGNTNGSATVAVSGNGPFTYAWSPSGGNAATATGLGAGAYSCLITDNNGCTQTTTLSLTQPSTLTTTAQASVSTICNGDSLQLTATSNGGTGSATYTWMPGNLTGSPMVAPTSSTTYTATATDQNGCTATSNAVSVVVNQNPIVNLGTDISNCGQAVILDAQNSGSTYLWNDSSSTQTITVTTSTVAYVMVTDANGCSSSDTINITIGQVPTINLVDQSSCAPIVLDAGNAGSTYTWNDNSAAQTFTVTNSGFYYVTVIDSNGCTNSDSATITINTPPTVELGNAQTQCGGTILLDAGNVGSTYLWNDSSMTQTLVVSTSGMYDVTVTDSNGCAQMDSVLITIFNQPVVTFAIASDTLCSNDANLTLNANPSGGTFTGPGVLGNTFDPSAANIGWNQINYTYIDSNGCNAFGMDSIWVDVCSGIAQSSVTQIRVYPNPNNGIFNLNANSNGMVEIFNQLGELVFVQQITTGQQEINTSNLATGIYIVRFTSNLAEVSHQQISIQH